MLAGSRKSANQSVQQEFAERAVTGSYWRLLSQFQLPRKLRSIRVEE